MELAPIFHQRKLVTLSPQPAVVDINQYSVLTPDVNCQTTALNSIQSSKRIQNQAGGKHLIELIQSIATQIKQNSANAANKANHKKGTGKKSMKTRHASITPRKGQSGMVLDASNFFQRAVSRMPQRKTNF